MAMEDGTGEVDVAETVRATTDEVCSENPIREVNGTLPPSAPVPTSQSAF